MSDIERHDAIQGRIIHVYDGIEEADNKLPLWWLWTFFGAVAFAAAYWFYFEVFAVGASPLQRYAQALEAQAARQGTVSAELLESLAKDPEALAEGKALFVSNCAVCHQENGAGKIGPNLTDAFWLHGEKPEEIYATIDKGVLAKGMPAWGPTLGAKATQRLAAYTLTLRGKNLPGKEPQGDPSL